MLSSETREAMIEKRREKAAVLHGAARQKEDSKDGLDVSDNFLMGGNDDYKARYFLEHHVKYYC